MPAIAERKLGSVSDLRKRISAPGGSREIEPIVKQELLEAPDKKAQASMVHTNIFEGIDTLFPVLLRKQTEHQMKAAQFYGELTMILNMANVKDPAASVYVYSLQVTEPRNFGDQLGKKVLEVIPGNLMPEIMNGYLRHELLYEQPEPDKSIILVNVVQTAAKVKVSLKPPWSAYRTDVLVTLK